jgi:hypothetical protein
VLAGAKNMPFPATLRNKTPESSKENPVSDSDKIATVKTRMTKQCSFVFLTTNELSITNPFLQNRLPFILI